METDVVECGTLLDGKSAPGADARLVVEGGRIVDAGPREAVDDGVDGVVVIRWTDTLAGGVPSERVFESPDPADPSDPGPDGPADA